MMHTFDSDFYVTTATVIPVLYVALFLQEGASFGSIVARMNRSPKVIEKVDVVKWMFEPPRSQDILSLSTEAIISSILRTVAQAILAFSLFGEIASLVVLYNQSDNAGMGSLILISVIGLLVITAAGPAWALITAEARYYSALGKVAWTLFKLSWRMSKFSWHEYTQARSERAQRDNVPSQPEPTPPEDPANPD